MRIAFVLFSVLLLATQAIAQDSYVLNPLWSQDLLPTLHEKFTVLDLWIQDINKDNNDEAVAVTAGSESSANTPMKNQLNAYSVNGTKLWTYGIDGRIQAALIYDLDNDGRKQFVIGTGQKLNNVQRGTIRIVGGDGKLQRSYDSTAIMNDLNIGDIDGDSYYEIVGGSEKRMYVFHKYGEPMWTYPPSGGPLLNNSFDAIFIKDLDEDKVGEVVAGADQIYYFDGQGNMIGNIDVEPSNAVVNKGFRYLFPADFQGGFSDVFFVTKSGLMGAAKIDRMTSSGNNIKHYETSMDWKAKLDCDINDVVKTKLSPGHEQILIACSNNRIYAYDYTGAVLWAYPVDGEPKNLFVRDIDGDGLSDILVAVSSGSIYSLDLSGEFKWRYQTGSSLLRIAAGDMDSDEVAEIITVNTEPRIEAYQVNSSYTYRRRADTVYNLGQEAYFASNYTQALSLLKQAQKMYERLDYEKGITNSKSLIIKIEGVVVDNRKKEADALYTKARESFEMGDYGNAKSFLAKALERYQEFMDTEGVVKCELLRLQIERATGDISPQVTLPQTTTTILSDQGAMENTEGYLIFAILLILAVIIVLVKKRAQSRSESGAETIETSKDQWEKDMNEIDNKMEGGDKA